jgi:hypothetical protein
VPPTLLDLAHTCTCALPLIHGTSCSALPALCALLPATPRPPSHPPTPPDPLCCPASAGPPCLAHPRDTHDKHQVAATSVSLGSHVLVRPGEQVPLDGAVVWGASNVSMQHISGESLPVKVEPGAEVPAGEKDPQAGAGQRCLMQWLKVHAQQSVFWIDVCMCVLCRRCSRV